MKKSVMIPLIVVGGIIQFFLYIFLIASFLTFLGSSYASQVQKELPEPAITYGEFPFEVVYEINGEQKVLKDTYICEYAGTDFDMGSGACRVWKGYVASTEKRDVVLISDATQEVVCDLGDPALYMGDLSEYRKDPGMVTPELVLIDYDNNSGIGIRRTISEDVLEKYKIKLISWELSEPIENSFGEE